MEAIVVTKQQLLEIFNEYNQCNKSVHDRVSFKVKKFDVLAYANDQEHMALAELQPDQEIPKPKIVQVTDQQFADLAKFYLKQADQLHADQNLSNDYLLQTLLK
jgi:hypothetical protein